jgi:hypothetical protein
MSHQEFHISLVIDKFTNIPYDSFNSIKVGGALLLDKVATEVVYQDKDKGIVI